MKNESVVLEADGRKIKVTHPEKVLFPDDGITKASLIHYYEEIGPRMIPYLAGRPLTLQRFPDGIGRPGFLQKAAASYYPAWIKTVTVKKEGGTLRQVVCDDVATLVYVANLGCVTPHVWLSRADNPDFPDQMVFDLDPSTDDFAAVVEGAHLLKDLLDRIGMPAFVKATGSRGLHIAVPLAGKDDFDTVRSFARQLAGTLVARDPARYTLEQYKSKRGNRVLIDINRNGYAQTVVANYAVRARRGAPVAVPLEWGDLRTKGFRPDGAAMRDVPRLAAKREDPWKGFWKQTVSLSGARRKMETLHAA